MVGADELQQQRKQSALQASFVSDVSSSQSLMQTSRRAPEGSQMPVQNGIPTLTLYNPTLDIRMVGINGAVIGRRQGPYQQLFEGNMYISGVHAQLIYKPDSGWCIIDKHSSNGTKLNQRDVMPDIPMTIKSGDIVTLANINLQVSIN
jgi:pSer/pThr/pTyr-binding forkhead associated (FHA) protein